MILQTITRIHKKAGRVTFCWVTARRVRGNENADKLAKRALKRDSRSRSAS